MGNQFGNAYQKKIYDTNQEILKQEYENLGKVLLQTTYDENLDTDGGLDDFYKQSSG